MKENEGFTLLEVVFALVMAAFIAAVVGMGIVRAVDAYIFARENAKLNQRVQVAVERIKRELTEITSVTDVKASALSYSRFGATCTIGLDGGALKIVEGAVSLTQGDVLLENVHGLVFTLRKDDGSSWDVATDDDRLLFSIAIVISVNHPSPGAGPITFSTAVNPRNTENPLGPLNVVRTTVITTTCCAPQSTSRLISLTVVPSTAGVLACRKMRRHVPLLEV